MVDSAVGAVLAYSICCWIAWSLNSLTKSARHYHCRPRRQQRIEQTLERRKRHVADVTAETLAQPIDCRL
jgi:hypothetical protein